jgi:hypothetical protein
VLDAEDLTIQAVNPAHRQLLGSRAVLGLPLTEILHGPEVNDLLEVLQTAVSEVQSQTVGPILASVDSEHNSTRYVHTVVPISDATGSNVTRIFIYSEKAERTGGG